MVSGDTILKWEMFVWILSHVPSAIALSLFILKSSNLDKINNASYPNLWCGNDSIIGCVQFETHPCSVRNFSVAKRFLFLFLIVLCTLRFPWLPFFCGYCIKVLRPLSHRVVKPSVRAKHHTTRCATLALMLNELDIVSRVFSDQFFCLYS